MPFLPVFRLIHEIFGIIHAKNPLLHLANWSDDLHNAFNKSRLGRYSGCRRCHFEANRSAPSELGLLIGVDRDFGVNAVPASAWVRPGLFLRLAFCVAERGSRREPICAPFMTLIRVENRLTVA